MTLVWEVLTDVYHQAGLAIWAQWELRERAVHA